MSVIKDIEINNGSGTPITADLGADAVNVDYDGTNSGLVSTNAQAAIDEVTDKTVKFIGTRAQWDALTTAQKQAYDGKPVVITDDFISSAAHIIVNGSGTEMEQRAKLKFVNATLSDDSTNDVTIVTVDKGIDDGDLVPAADVVNIIDGISW